MSKTCVPEIPLCVTQGDTETYNLAFTQDGTTVLDLTGSTIEFVVIKSRSDPEADAVIAKTITSFAAPTTGEAELELTSVDTNQPLGKYFHRLKIEFADGKVKTIMKGDFDVVWAK